MNSGGTVGGLSLDLMQDNHDVSKRRPIAAPRRKAKVVVPVSVRGELPVSPDVADVDSSPRTSERPLLSRPQRSRRRWSVADPCVAEVIRTFNPKHASFPRQSAEKQEQPDESTDQPRRVSGRRDSAAERLALTNRMEAISEENSRQAAELLHRRASIAPGTSSRRSSLVFGNDGLSPHHYFKLSRIAMKWYRRRSSSRAQNSGETDEQHSDSDDDFPPSDVLQDRFASQLSPQAQYAMLMCYEDRLRRLFHRYGNSETLPPRPKTPTRKKLEDNGVQLPAMSGRESVSSINTGCSVDLDEKRRRIARRLVTAQQLIDSLKVTQRGSEEQARNYRRWSVCWSKEFNLQPDTEYQLTSPRDTGNQKSNKPGYQQNVLQGLGNQKQLANDSRNQLRIQEETINTSESSDKIQSAVSHEKSASYMEKLQTKLQGDYKLPSPSLSKGIGLTQPGAGRFHSRKASF